MISRFALAAACLAAIASCAAQAQTAPANSGVAPAVYEHVFRHVRHLKTVSDAAAAQGRASTLRSYYKNLAHLTQAQADAFEALSLASMTQLEALDQQAQALILQWRAQVRTSKPAVGQKAPAPPAALADLQLTRNAMLVANRNSVLQTLGPSAFASLEQALTVHIQHGNVIPGQSVTPKSGGQ